MFVLQSQACSTVTVGATIDICAVGCCCRQCWAVRADSNGAAVQPDHKWTGVLCGGSPALHICITDTHHEWGVPLTLIALAPS